MPLQSLTPEFPSLSPYSTDLEHDHAALQRKATILHVDDAIGNVQNAIIVGDK
jgi:hypothetical protein